MTLTNKILYFRFEEDFIEDNLRCIPMIVRMKLDLIGIKLSLKLWSRLNVEERSLLAVTPCATKTEIEEYRNSVIGIIRKDPEEPISTLNTADNANWQQSINIPVDVKTKCDQFNSDIALYQWQALTTLQRFALIKLSRPGHESKNFEKALIEFGLFKKEI